MFARWFALQKRPLCRAIRVVQRALNLIVYGSWHAVMRWRTPTPVTFDDKVHYQMAHDLRPILMTISDKVAVRDYVAVEIGS